MTEAMREFKTVTYKAPLTGRGYVTFVNIRGKSWICDGCGQRVVPSQFERHARGKEHVGGE